MAGKEGRLPGGPAVHETDDLPGTVEDRLRDGGGAVGTLAEDAIDPGRVGKGFLDPRSDRRGMGDGEFGERGLEFGEGPAGETRHARIRLLVGKGRVDVDEVAGLGAR